MRPAESVATFIERSESDQERREAKAAWCESGGSRRRALKSFRTAEESAEHRTIHGEYVEAAIRALSTPDGARAFLMARELNPHLSAGNAALAAYHAPGAVVGTIAHWRKQGAKVKRGEGANFTLTGPPRSKFWPTAAFTHDQVNVEPLPEHELERAGEVDSVQVGLVSWGIAQALRSRKPSARLVSEITRAMEAVYESQSPEGTSDNGGDDGIPF